MAETEKRNLPVAEEPEFSAEIPAIRPDDPVHFAQMNAMFESLLGNDVFLKRLANKMIEKSLIAHVLDCENSQMVLGADQGPMITGLIDGVKEDVTQLYSEINCTVLWENHNPTSIFPGQIITLQDDISNYKYYEIEYVVSIGLLHHLKNGKIPVNFTTLLQLTYGSIGYRTFSPESFRFGNASIFTHYGDATQLRTDNSFLIPVKIIGWNV